MFHTNKDIDDRKDKLYKKMIYENSQKRDEKLLKKQAAKEVKLLKKHLFNKKESKENEKNENINMIDELMLFIKK